ncbi:14549_t:CDS:1, partial [Funneliformis caledonium]
LLPVVYEDEDMKEKAEKVLGHIIWLLEEAQKPMEDSRSEDRDLKKAKIIMKKSK